MLYLVVLISCHSSMKHSVMYGSLVILTVHVFVISGVHYKVKNDTTRKAILVFTKYD
jgi:hypothetical protein